MRAREVDLYRVHASSFDPLDELEPTFFAVLFHY